VERRAALDRQGSEATKTTGLFAALILGVDYQPQSGLALISLSLALLLLLVSIAVALAATRLLRYMVTGKEGLDEILCNRWELSETTARSTVAQLSAITIDTLRTGNDSKP
jgi:hypothetical protein